MSSRTTIYREPLYARLRDRVAHKYLAIFANAQNTADMIRLFAIGDIHGCFDSLEELVENKIQLNKNDTLVLLGDYIDRGDKSKEVIDYIIDLQGKDYNIIPLIGNHELLLLETFEDENNKPKWLQNGGGETLKSFGVDSIKDISTKYLDFFRHRPITIGYCEMQINENKQVINIDTGCVYKEKVGFGKLTAIELYSKKLLSV